MNKKILFVSHKKSQCGIFEFGKNISDALKNSKNFKFIRVECSSLNELKTAIHTNSPGAIIYNYGSSVLPWVATKIAPMLWKNNISFIKIPQIGIIHEITQDVANSATSYKNEIMFGVPNLSNTLFDYYIAPDPTLLLLNPFVYKTGRLIPVYENKFRTPAIPVFGSLGFATPNKGFEKIVQLVQQQFDEAEIRLNIPAADFGDDRDCVRARSIGEKCKLLITKSGIRLTITHKFLDENSMLDFLAKNTINVFLYENDKSSIKGLSSAIDNAMAVQRPIAVSDSITFRHLFDVEPSICVSKFNLKTIIQNGFTPLNKHYSEWNSTNLIWEYENILNSIFSKHKKRFKTKTRYFRMLKSNWNMIFSKPVASCTWARGSTIENEDDIRLKSSLKYQAIKSKSDIPLNRILDNEARELYSPVIDTLKMLVPKTMERKISQANVQQAFVFDTINRFLPSYKYPKLLCVGSYEDTASMSLKKLGHSIEEIDPILNYSLQEYFTKPTTVINSYDIIFSTSVIEHEPDDEKFICCIADLLAPGGVAIIVCDYKDYWKPGDSKPECNARLYTKHDLKERLLPLMSNCNLVDLPQWDCPNPDFVYLGKYKYTFATFVVRKNA